MSNLAISVHELTKVYPSPDGGEIRAVDSISFGVEKGEVFGLLGPNGAGKTTTLEILEGLRMPTSGQGEVLGVPVGTKNFSERTRLASIIGVQLQESSYFEELTLVETLELLGSFYPKSREPHSLLELVSLKDKASSKYSHLSGGQARRFAIAAAMVNDPKVLFLDEPTTGLDPQARRSLWQLIKDIQERQQVTVVLTTHYMEEAEILCDRVGIVDGGKIVALDTPRNLIATLGGSYAASIIASGIDPDSVEAMLENSIEESEFHELTHDRIDQAVRIGVVSPTPAAVFRFLEELTSRGANIVDLSVHNASLEDVFLKLTGKTLRD